jgi:hypothetical protein
VLLSVHRPGHHSSRSSLVAVAGLLVLGTTLATSCSNGSTTASSGSTGSAAASSSTPGPPTSTPSPSTAATPATPSTVAVSGFDYEFAGIPPAIGAGSTLTFTNTSSKEAHELVVFRLPDGDHRTAEDLAAVPIDQLESSLGGPPVLVSVAAPNADGTVTVGDGTIATPGTYVALCAVPTGADPSAYVAAADQSKGAPVSVPGGLPHYMGGMIQEVTVT